MTCLSECLHVSINISFPSLCSSHPSSLSALTDTERNKQASILQRGIQKSMSGEAGKRQRAWGDADILLSISQASWSLSDSLFTKLGCFSKGKREKACGLNYPLKQSGIHQVDSQERQERKTSFQKPIFYLTRAAGDRWGTIWKWDRRDREGRQAGTDERMKHYVWQTMWQPKWKKLARLRQRS